MLYTKEENDVMDALDLGPGSTTDIAGETGFKIEKVRRIVKKLESIGLIRVWGYILSGNHQQQAQYELVRIKDVA